MSHGDETPQKPDAGGDGAPLASEANATPTTRADVMRAVSAKDAQTASAEDTHTSGADGTDATAANDSPTTRAADTLAASAEVPQAERADDTQAAKADDTLAATGEETLAAEPATTGPKMVRRVVCSYRLGWLPGDWLQTWRRLDRVFARADLKVKATLAPLEDLPKDTDILVVPPDLRDDARAAAAPGTTILVTPASAAAGAFADLLNRLQAGTEFTAEKVDPADKDKPKIVSYRGHTLID